MGLKKAPRVQTKKIIQNSREKYNIIRNWKILRKSIIFCQMYTNKQPENMKSVIWLHKHKGEKEESREFSAEKKFGGEF